MPLLMGFMYGLVIMKVHFLTKCYFYYYYYYVIVVVVIIVLYGV